MRLDFARVKKVQATAKMLGIVVLALTTQIAYSQNNLRALPSGGNVVAGNATITQSNLQLNINQTSQRAVVTWDQFNVGKDATVNFNQPNSSAVTLNRVTGASESVIDGAVRANGQVILVNPNGVTFGKGAQVDAAGVVASTLDISNKNFMEGNNTYSGNAKGAVVNQGTITANTKEGYIALLAPEVRNEGYLLAKKGANNTVAMASGEKITLDFRGDQLLSVKVDQATYKGLIDNKRLVEVQGGLIVVAAGTAGRLMATTINNTGVVSASSAVSSGGMVHFVAANINQAGKVAANGKGAQSDGGNITLVGDSVTLAAGSQTVAKGTANGGTINVGTSGVTSVKNADGLRSEVVAKDLAKTTVLEKDSLLDASSTVNGNGGQINVWSSLKTSVAGVIKAMGGPQGGDGGFVETSSKAQLVIQPTASVNTSAPKGKVGKWLLDPIDLTIDPAVARVISAALSQNNVVIDVNATTNTCPAIGVCSQNGSGGLTIAAGADILKLGNAYTSLTLSSSGEFNLNANIIGQNLNVYINSSTANLNAGTKIEARSVTIQAQKIYSNGIILGVDSDGLGGSIALLAQAIYISRRLNVSSSTLPKDNLELPSVTYNGEVLNPSQLPAFLKAQNNFDASKNELDAIYLTSAANDAKYFSQQGASGNVITLNASRELVLYSGAEVRANGTTGMASGAAGAVYITAPVLSAEQGSLIQANGNNGPGGLISLSGDKIDLAGTIQANGTQGGSFAVNSNTITLFQSALVQTNGSTGRGGGIQLSSNNGSTSVSGALESIGATRGGNVLITANHISLENNSSITATGNTGGGIVLVGGDWQGSNGVYQATTVTMNQGAVIDASALVNGDGGKVVLWSDVHNADSVTKVDGRIFAKAGLLSGNGGQVETSGKLLEIGDAISVSTKASKGLDGEWFLDPEHLWIRDPSWSGYNYTTTGTTTYTALTANTSATILVSGADTRDRGPTVNGVFIPGVTVIRTDTIVNALNSGNVRVLATGLIDVAGWQAAGIANYYINSTTTNKLTLEAGTTLNLDAGSINNKVINLPNGTLELLAGTSISQNSSLSGGSINAGTLILGKCSGCSTNPSVTLNNSNNQISNLQATNVSSVNVVSANALTVNASGLSVSGSVNLSSTSTVTLTGSITTSDASNGNIAIQATGLTGSGNVSLANGRELAVNQSGTSTYSGVISGTSSTLTKSGAGALSLTGTNTYSGGTLISAGTLQVGNGSTTGTLGSGDVTNNATLKFDLSADATFANNISGTGTLEVVARFNRFYDSTSSSSLSNSTFVTIATNTTVAELLNRISGGVMQGSATGGSVSGVESGVNNKTFDAATNTASFYILYQDTQYTKRQKVLLQQSGANVQAKVDSSGFEYVANTTTAVLNAVSNVAFDGDMGYAVGYSGGGYGLRALDQAAKITFTGNLSHTGATTLTAVTTAATSGLCGTTGMICVRYVNPTLQVSGSLGSSAITNNGNLIFANSSAQTYGGVISGTGVIINNAAADVTLSVANTFSGNVYLQAGKVIAGNNAAFGTAPVYQVSGLAATVDLNGKTITNNFYLGGNGASGVGAITNGNATSATLSGAIALIDNSLVNTNNPITVSGVISGAYGLTKSGSGSLTLSAANTYTGATTLTGGTLSVATLANGGLSSNLGASSNAAANLVFDGGTLAYTGSAVSTDRLFTITNNGGTIDASGTGALNFTNAGAIAYTGTNARSLTLTGSNTGNNTLSPVFANSTGLSSLTKTGAGTWLLAGANTYTGVTTINGGVLSVGTLANGGANSHIGASTNAASNLVLNGGTLKYTGADISSDRLFTIGANGGTIDASGSGALNFTNAGSIGFAGTTTRSLNLIGSGTATLSQILGDNTGATSLTKSGSGTWTLSGTNTYTGVTTISSGILSISSDSHLGAVPGSVNANEITLNGGTLQATANMVLNSNRGITLTANSGIASTSSNRLVYAGIITGGFDLNINGNSQTGTVALAGSNTYSGATTVSAGTLGLYKNDSLGSSAITLAGSTTLLLGRSVTNISNAIALTGNATVAFDTNVEYLVVGGGGAGGSGTASEHGGGGGGGGGVLVGSTSLSSDSYAITVGSGGSIAAATSAGGTGSSSSFAGQTALGGGGGATYNALASTGSSGGGGAVSGTSARRTGASGTVGQGNSGGSASTGIYDRAAGGGGGAGGAGGSNTGSNTGGNGGAGLVSDITGSASAYGGGGGGGGFPGGSATAGGSGGSYNLTAGSSTPGAAALANTGGGGGGGIGNGGANQTVGGAGGSGIVIVRYLGGDAAVGGTKTVGSGAATGYTLHTFTTTGASTLTLNPLASTFSGIVSGSRLLTVNAAGGTMTLSGANTHTGGTTVSGGLVKAGIASTGAAGAVTNGPFGRGLVTVNSGFTVDLNGYVIANAFNLSGAGISSNGALINSSSTALTLPGTVTLAADTTISSTGDLTLSGAITSATFGLALKNGGNYSLSNSSNTLSTLAATGIASLNVTNNATLTVGAVNSIAGISSAGAITLTANAIELNGNLTVTTSSTDGVSLLSKTYISNTSLSSTTINTQGGKLLMASNIDDATDGDSTVNGYITFREGLTVNTRGGDITIGGGNVNGTGYALGSSTTGLTEGVRIDKVLSLTSGGGNISIKGKSYAASVASSTGGAGFGIYYLNSAGTINSGTGTIYIEGYSQTTNTSSYGAGLLFALNNSNVTTITSANTTANAIKLVGVATGTGGDTWGMEIETNSPLSVYATGAGGGLTISTSQKVANYDIVVRSEWQMLAASGDIKLLGSQNLSGSQGSYTGALWVNANVYIGSKAGTSVASSSSDVYMSYQDHFHNGYRPFITTSGKFDWKPPSDSFSNAVDTGWFTLSGISGLYVGKLTNAYDIFMTVADVTVAGSVEILAMAGTSADIKIDNALTVTGSNASITLKAAEYVYNNGAITMSGSGANTFTVMAGRDFYSNAAISGATGKPMTVNIFTDVDNTGGGAIILNTSSRILSYGGNITLNGGTGDTTSGCAAAKTCTAGFASNSGGNWLSSPSPGYQDDASGIVIVSNGSIDAGAGAISMKGRTSDAYWYGVLAYYGGTQIKAGGNISITGITASGGNGWGVYLESGTLWSTAGNVSITGTGSNAVYLGSQAIVAGNTTSNPSAGGTVTINATGNTSGYYGLRQTSSSIVSFDAITINATAIGNQAFQLNGTGSKVQSASDITISGTQGNWGLAIYDNAFIQSTKANSAANGNISITANGTTGGLYTNTTGGIFASSNTVTPTATPTAGGTLTIVATGGTEQGVYLNTGSLVSFGAMSVSGTATTAQQGVRTAGTGEFKSVGNITINAVAGGSNHWAAYLDSGRYIQSTTGNISLTATATTGHGIYLNGGGIVAGNDTTTPTAGGSISISASSGNDNGAGAGLRLDTNGTKIIAFGDINIYANGAVAGLNTANQQGHGVILYGSSQTIRSYGGNLSITGYANRVVGSGFGADISGGITLLNDSNTLRAYGNLTLKGVSMQGIGIYLTVSSGAGGSVTSDTGNIVIDGLSNSGYAATYIRIPMVATLGSISISGAGNGAGIYQDGYTGSVTAKNDVNMIGYATGGHGIYLGFGSVTSSNGNMVLSGYTSSATTSYYGIYSNTINASAVNGSINFQGAKINSASTGSGYLVNAAGTMSGGSPNLPAPLFAVADSTNPAFAASTGLSWSGNVTANTSTGYIQLNAKAPSITGVMTAYGLALLSNNQSYNLNNSSNSISSLAANIGTGSLTFTTSSVLNIGTYNSVSGITAASVTLSAGGLTDTNDAGITVTSSSTVAITNATGSYDFSGVIAGPIALTKSGAGTQTLSAANTYTGLTTISAGTLRLGASGTATNSPLGTTAAGTSITAGATLDLNGYTLGTSEALTINGYGVGSNGALINSSASTPATYSGAITVGSAAYIGGAGAMTLTGAVGAASYGVGFVGAGSYTLTNTNNTLSTIATSGIGSLTLKNNAALTIGTVNAINGMTFSGNASIDVNDTITMLGYTIQKNGSSDSTLTLKASGRVNLWHSGNQIKTDTATGTGKLNLIFWAESDGGNTLGTTLAGTFTTNGGHIWAGGGSGSTTWNGLTVGNGAAGGGAVNVNAVDTQGTWTTSGGSIWLAGNVGTGSGPDLAIANGATQVFNVGAGSITLIGDYQYIGTTSVTSTGTLTIAPYGNGFTDGSGVIRPFTWSGSGSPNFAGTGSIANMTINSMANLGGLVIGNATSNANANVTISNAIGIAGPISIYGGNITVGAALTTTGGVNSPVTLIAADSIKLSSGNVTTSGAAVLVSSNRDGLNGGGINVINSTISTSGGNITLGGGTDGSAYAEGSASSIQDTLYRGMWLSGATLNASTGNVVLKGKGWQGATYGASTIYYSIGIDMVGGSSIRTTGSGNITLDGVGGVNYSAANHSVGINFYTGGTANSIYSVNGNVSILGTAGTSTARTYAAINNDGGVVEIYSTTGNVTLTGNGASTDYGLNVVSGATLYAGYNSAATTATSGNILIQANRLNATGVLNLKNSGVFTVEPIANSFTSALSWPLSNVNLVSSGGLTIGKSTNTADITIGSATSVAGPITIYGGAISINAALTATGNTITLAGSGNVTDGASGYLVATNLLLQGGSVTLDNAANNAVSTLAASGVSALTFANKSALTIGTVGSTSGVSASDVINLSTYAGDLTVAQSIGTTNTSSSAMVLNAASNSAVGTSTGGNVILSGSPSITTGTNGRVVIYTGSVSGSTGLTAYVGSGSGNFRYYSKLGTSNFTTALGASGKYAVYRQAVSATVTTNSQTVVYGDTITLTGTTSGLVNGDLNTYSVSSPAYSTSNNIKVGSYTILGAGAAGLGYTVTASNGTLTVGQKAVTISGFAVADKTYDGNTTATVTNSGTVSGQVSGDVVTVSSVTAAFTNKNAGLQNLVISGGTLSGADSSNYTSSISGSTTARINAKAVTLTAPVISKTYNSDTAYTTSAANLTSLSSQLGVSGDTVTAATLAFTDKNAGTSNKTVTLSGAVISDGNSGNNYTITYASNSTSTINRAALSVTGVSTSVTYTGLAQTNGVASLSGVQGSDSFTISGYGTGTNYSATAYADNLLATPASGTLATNYTITYTNGGISIGKAGLVVTADNKTRFYGDANPTLTYTVTGFVNNETASVLSGAPTIASTASLTSNVGNVAITAAANNLTATNYSFTYANGTLAITPAALSVTGANRSTTYSGLAQTNSVATLTGLKNSDSFTVTGYGSGTNYSATPYADSLVATPVSGTLASNYTISYSNGGLSIAKANATVTANGASVTYTGLNQSVSGFTATGLVNGQTTSVLTGVSASGANGTNAGTYTNTVSGTAANYNLTFVNGSLVIGKASATVTGNSASVTYTGLAQSVNGFTASGLVNGETTAVLTSVTAGGATGTNAGTYTNAVSGTAANYNLTFVNGSLVIGKASLLVTADNKSRVYGDANPTLTYTVTGYVNGEGASAYSGSPTLTTAADLASNVGNLVITAAANNMSAANYDFRYANGVMRINARPITVTADANQSKVLYSADPILTYTLEAKSEGRGLVGLDTFSGNLTRALGEDIGNGYAILQGTINNGNYAINFVPSLFEIKAPPTTYSVGVMMSSIASNNNFQTSAPIVTSTEVPKGSQVNVTQTFAANTQAVTVITAQIPVAQINNFSFKIPDQIARNISASGSGVTAQLADGRELPTWLKFDTKTMEFKAQPEAGGSLPLDPIKISIRFGSETVIVEIKPIDIVKGP